MQADAVSIDAGKLSADFDQAAEFGPIRAAGPTAERRYANDAQDGVALGVGYVTDNFAADIGTTRSDSSCAKRSAVWNGDPICPEISVSIGSRRRASAAACCRMAGMRDPIRANAGAPLRRLGPYADAGIYRERYSIAGALRFSEITGEHDARQQILRRASGGDWKFFAELYAQVSASASPSTTGSTITTCRITRWAVAATTACKSYASVALPLEVWGEYRDWSYRLRGSIAHSAARPTPFRFIPWILRYEAPSVRLSFAATASGSTSFSAYAAVERQLSPTWIVGMKLDIDRADYYDPTVFSIYLRHTLAPWTTRIAVPPRPYPALQR